MHDRLTLDTAAPTGSVDSTGAEVRSVTGDRTTVHSAGQRTESVGDKSETGLKRVAEKMVNYDMTPVAQALARHLGIDLTTDGVQARNRRGISMLVHGPPGSGTSTVASREWFDTLCSSAGKSMVAQELSQMYHCTVLSLDQVIIDAIDSQQRSDHAQRAHHLCRDALDKHIEEQRQAEADADHAAPTQTGRQRGDARACTDVRFSGAHAKKPTEKKKKAADVIDPNAQAVPAEAQPLTSPPSIKFRIHKSSSVSTEGELSSERRRETDTGLATTDDDQEELMTAVLSEEIFVEILSARLQVRISSRFPVRSSSMSRLESGLSPWRDIRQSRHVVPCQSYSSSHCRTQSDQQPLVHLCRSD